MKTSGLDVHKDSIFCAIYDGKSYSVIKEFSTTTVLIRALGGLFEIRKSETGGYGKQFLQYKFGIHPFFFYFRVKDRTSF
jgi:hypothetical protein